MATADDDCSFTASIEMPDLDTQIARILAGISTKPGGEVADELDLDVDEESLTLLGKLCSKKPMSDI